MVKARSSAAASRRVVASEHGLTFVEMLVTIAVVALLVTLSVSALSTVQSRAKDTRFLSTLRQHTAIISLYAKDHAGFFPNPLTVEGGKRTLRSTVLNDSVDAAFLDTTDWWWLAIADGYYADRGDLKDLQWPLPGGALGPAKAALSLAFYAEPDYWNLRTRTRVPEQLGTRKDYEVVYPAQKFVMGQAFSNDALGNRAAKLPVSFVDGHARVVESRERGETGPFEVDCLPRYRVTPPGVLSQFQYTLDGVRGRDVR